MAGKLTDQEIGEARTKRTMIVSIGHEDWAMSQEDAFTLLAIFTRSRHVEQVHTSDYRKSLYIEHEDQEPPIQQASVGHVRLSEPIENTDQFSAATRAVS